MYDPENTHYSCPSCSNLTERLGEAPKEALTCPNPSCDSAELQKINYGVFVEQAAEQGDQIAQDTLAEWPASEEE